MPWDYPCDEKLSFDARSERQEQVIKELVDEILKTPDVLKQFLIQLSQGQQRMTVAFGKYLGHKIDRAEYWLAEIKDALKAVNSDKRNFGLLGGYLAGMQDRLPAIVSEFKKQSVKSDNYAPALPFVCLQLGIKAEDIKLVCEALSNGKLPVGLLMNWTLGGVFAKLPPKAVVPLFDTLFSMDDQAYTVALDLLGMYVHNDYGRLDKLKPQVRKMAEVAFRKSRSSGSQLDTHHFQEIMKWILDKGRADPDASAAALSLVKEVAKDISIKNEDFIKPLIPRLLSNFPEIVWPVISQAIASDRKLSWRFEHLLGDTFSFSNRKNAAILSLPEDVLFAWCHAMPDVGPAFVAVVAPLLIENDNLGNVLHPLVKRLLNEFGDREDVLSNLDRNMHTFGWSGSVTTYFALYHEPLRSLLAHPKEQVRKWARKTLQRIRLNIQSEKNREEEQEAMWEL